MPSLLSTRNNAKTRSWRSRQQHKPCKTWLLRGFMLGSLFMTFHVGYLAGWTQQFFVEQDTDLVHQAPVTFTSIDIHPSKPDNVTKQSEAPAVFDPVTTPHSDTTPFLRDTLCGGCRKIVATAVNGKNQHCGYLIYMTVRDKTKGSLSILEGAQRVATQYPACQRCVNCSNSSKIYWRFDAVAPTLCNATTHWLPSISAPFRIPDQVYQPPHKALQQVQAYFGNPHNVYPARQYYFEYNPSIVALTPDQKSRLVTTSNNDSDSTLMMNDAVYLASYRISNLQSCFPPDITLAMIGGDWDKRPEPYNLLGLALLRSDLSMIQDVVVKVPDTWTHFIDTRLFVLHNQIYIASNCEIFPLWISINPQQEPLPNNTNNNNTVMSVADRIKRKGMLLQLSNHFPSTLSVAIRSMPSLCSRTSADMSSAKNLNYFVDAQGQTVFEYFPMQPRVVRQVDVTKTPTSLIDKGNDPLAVEYRSPQALRPPSFFTRDEVDLANRRDYHEGVYTRERGSACCVRIDTPPSGIVTNSTWLYMGIAHVKTPYGRKRLQNVVPANHYLSRVYAFEPQAPYRIVAQSGLFCFPDHPTSRNEHALAKVQTHNKLTIADTAYNCPPIHFITGLVVNADDPSKLIIGYGVEDCTSWFVEVDKADVIDLLLGPPRPKWEGKER